jgi:hypothetical protein
LCFATRPVYCSRRQPDREERTPPRERQFVRSRPVPGQTPPNSSWETRTFRSARKGGPRRAERLLQWAPHRKAPGSPEGIWTVRKGSRKPAGGFLETLSFWNTVGLLQWDTSRRAKRAQSTASSRKRKDLTPKSEASNFEGLPRTPAERSADGARPNLENSTACQKSMPITSSRGGSEPGQRSGDAVTSNENPLVDNEFLAIASCSCSVSETTLLG